MIRVEVIFVARLKSGVIFVTSIKLGEIFVTSFESAVNLACFLS